MCLIRGAGWGFNVSRNKAFYPIVICNDDEYFNVICNDTTIKIS